MTNSDLENILDEMNALLASGDFLDYFNVIQAIRFKCLDHLKTNGVTLLTFKNKTFFIMTKQNSCLGCLPTTGEFVVSIAYLRNQLSLTDFTAHIVTHKDYRRGSYGRELFTYVYHWCKVNRIDFQETPGDKFTQATYERILNNQ